MRVTSFNCAPLWCTVMFICIGQVLCQESPCNQQLIAELASILETNFAILDEKVLEIGNRLSGVEHALSKNQILQEKTFSNLGNIKDDLSQEMQELKSEVSLLQDNLNEALDNKISLLHKDLESSFEIEVSTMSTSVNDDLESSFEIEVSTMSTSVNDGVLCPESDGFLMIQGTSQCLQVIRKYSTWDAAVEYCTSRGLQLLAQPEDPLALQAYLNNKYGGSSYWLNGRGDGSVLRWFDEAVLHSDDPLYGRSRTDTTVDPAMSGSTVDTMARTQCLGLGAHEPHVRAATPYWDSPCHWTRYHICKRVRLG